MSRDVENQRLQKKIGLQDKLITKLVTLLKKPPPGMEYAIFVRPHPGGNNDEVDVMADSQLIKVILAVPNLAAKDLKCGCLVLMRGSGVVVEVFPDKEWPWGEEVIFKQLLTQETALVLTSSHEVVQGFLNPELKAEDLKDGDRLLNCSGILLRVLPEIEKDKPQPDYAMFVRKHPGGKENEMDVLARHILVKVALGPNINLEELKCGMEVLVYDRVLVETTGQYWPWGTEVIFKELAPEGMAWVTTKQNTLELCLVNSELKELKEGDRLLICEGVVVKVLPKEDKKDFLKDLADISHLSWLNVGGLEEAKAQIHRTLLPFRHPDIYKTQFKGETMPRGMILHGPSGCGKTLVAKVIAAEVAKFRGLKCYFMPVPSPALSNKYVGNTSENIRTRYEYAKKLAGDGCLVMMFWDEFDGLFRSRDQGMEHEPWQAEHIAQMNLIMDGVEPFGNILLIAATNHKHLVDAALLRPDRLGIDILVPRPKTEEDMKSILKIYLTPDLPFAAQYFETDADGNYEFSDRFGSGKTEKIFFGKERDSQETRQKVCDHFIDMVIKRLRYDGPPVEVTFDDDAGHRSSIKVDNRFTAIDDGAPKEIYLKEHLSGAVLKSIVDGAKRMALARFDYLMSRGDKSVYDINKRDFFRAIDEELKRLKHSFKETKHKPIKGF